MERLVDVFIRTSAEEQRQRAFRARRQADRLDGGVLVISVYNQEKWPWAGQEGSPARGSYSQSPQLRIVRREDGKATFTVAGRRYVSVDSFTSINNRAAIGDAWIFWVLKRVSADMKRIVFIVDIDEPEPQPTAVFVYAARAASIPPAGRGRPR
jgi:hypothetical protein